MTAWQKAWAGFQARAPREKALLVGALLALVAMVGDQLFTAPAFAARKAAQAQVQQAEATLQTLQATLLEQSKAAAERRAQHDAEMKQLREELARLQAETRLPLDGPRMLALLDTLVARQQGRVQLEALKALPDPRTLQTGADPAAKPLLYQHGVEVVVTGPYKALHDYLQALGAEPLLRVRHLQLQVREHPQLALKLHIETSSPQSAWLTL